jgi:hypothetical protein
MTFSKKSRNGVLRKNLDIGDGTYAEVSGAQGVFVDPSGAASLVGGNKEAIYVASYKQAMAAGWITGGGRLVSNGFLSSVGAVTDTPVNPLGAVNLLTTGVQMTFTSADAQDDAAGTGMRTMLVEHIRQDYTREYEVVTLNGGAVVSTVTDTIFINDMRALTAGNPSGHAAGNITASNGGTNYGIIPAGIELQQSSYRMIPKDTAAVLHEITVGSVSGTATAKSVFSLELKLPTATFFTAVSEACVQDTTIVIPLTASIATPAGSIIGVEVTSDKAAIVTAAYSGHLEPA